MPFRYRTQHGHANTVPCHTITLLSHSVPVLYPALPVPCSALLQRFDGSPAVRAVTELAKALVLSVLKPRF